MVNGNVDIPIVNFHELLIIGLVTVPPIYYTNGPILVEYRLSIDSELVATIIALLLPS